MSDLAPFVAAVLRDKVLSDLKKENDELREEVRKSRIVELVGRAPEEDNDEDDDDNPQDFICYQQAQFDTDGHVHGNPNLWQVNFSYEDNTMHQYPACTLEELANVEIVLGGITKACFHEVNSFQVYLTDHSNENEEELLVNVFFSGTEGLWIRFGIGGWPLSQRQNLEDIEQGDEWEYLMETVTRLPPTKTVRFDSIAFVVKGIRGLVSRLPEDKQPRHNHEDEAARRFYGTVVFRVRQELGSDATPYMVSQRSEQLYEGLTFFDIEDDDVDPEYQGHIIGMMLRLQTNMHEEGNGEGFVDRARAIGEAIARGMEETDH